MEYGECSVSAVLVMQDPGPRLDSQNTCVKERAQLHSPVVPAPGGGGEVEQRIHLTDFLTSLCKSMSYMLNDRPYLQSKMYRN